MAATAEAPPDTRPSPLRAFTVLARGLLAPLAADFDIGELLERILRKEPVLAHLLRDSLVAAYLRRARHEARRVPLAVTLDPGGPSTPDLLRSILPGPESPIRFPGMEAAGEWLRNRRLMLPEDFRQLGAQASRTGFTVARSATLDAVGRVRDAVADNYIQGGTLAEFREDVRESLHHSMLAEHRVETLYRTHTGQAQAAAQRAVLEHELVRSEFPYRLWTATHDDRVRPTHIAMERHGQNGTGVYRSDDPMWDTLWPPCEWNCRCVVISLTLEDAAAWGSHEAERWLRTGTPPENPIYAARPYPIIPPEGWPSHHGVSAVV